MPKNSSSQPYPSIRPLTPITPKSPKPDGIGGLGGAPGGVLLEPLLLVLSHLDPAIVATLHVGDHVILQIDSLPIMVTTLLGLPIGQVGIDDVTTVRSRHARRGVVVAASTNPLGCIVEVR